MRSMKLMPLIFTLLMSFGFSGCSSSEKKAELSESNIMTEDQDTGADDMSFELNGDSDSGKAGSLTTVYFDFNSSSLSSSTRDALESNAAFLKENASVEIQIEGHCDERGGVQYNLALGERRANAVKQYLISMGVPSSRVSTVSFGKERPVSFGHDESSWSRNRRANFVITTK